MYPCDMSTTSTQPLQAAGIQGSSRKHTYVHKEEKRGIGTNMVGGLVQQAIQAAAMISLLMATDDLDRNENVHEQKHLVRTQPFDVQ